ncbi:MAG: hypothetical protein QM765_29470 [Myxococcales bacterium]
MTLQVDSRFPRLAAYLSALPQGLASHPECQAKGAMVRQMVSDPPEGLPTDALPAEIRQVILSPPLNSQWVPDTWFFGALLVFADQRKLSARGYVDWMVDANRKLFKSPVYRLLSLATPSILLSLGAATWGSTHRGTKLEVHGQTSGKSGSAVLSFPEGHYSHPDVLGAIQAGVQVAIELSNAKNPRLTVARTTPTTAEFTATWE